MEVKEGPSHRALRQLNNRNNLAELKLRKTLEQFAREKTFSITHLEQDRLDTKDFLKTVKQRNSDYLPSCRNLMGSPSRRAHTAKTAPSRFMEEGSEGSVEDELDVPGVPGSDKLPNLNDRRRNLSDYQRAEQFLRRLRQKVLEDEVTAHYTDGNPQDFVCAVVNKLQHAESSTVFTPSESTVNVPTMIRPVKVDPLRDGTPVNPNMVYPIQLLGNFQPQYAARRLTPSPSLGPGSPQCRATPLGIPEGGAIGLQARLVMTAPMSLTSASLNSPLLNGRSLQSGLPDMRLSLRSGFTRKPLNQRVRDFCHELDEIRTARGGQLTRRMSADSYIHPAFKHT